MSDLRGVVCPMCAVVLDVQAESIACEVFCQRYLRVAGIPVLLPKPEQHLALWKGQLKLLLESGRRR